MGIESQSVKNPDWSRGESSSSVEQFRSELFLSTIGLFGLDSRKTDAAPAAKTDKSTEAKTEKPGESKAEKPAEAKSELPTLILLKEQKNEVARKEQIERVAGELATFIKGADKSLDIAIYHFQLSGNAAKQVVEALNDRAEHGVKIRLAIFQPEQKKEKKGATEAETKKESGESEAAISPEFLSKLSPRIKVHDGPPLNSNLVGDLDKSIKVGGIRAHGKLMHDKYIVRDGGTDSATIWTGSTNFTDDAFGSQDNNIIQLKSKDLAATFEKNFQQMWDKGAITGTGKGLFSTAKMGDSTVSVAFSPGDGALIDKEIAKRIESANQSVHIASMDISSQKILKALADKIDEGVTVKGVYDGPQMGVVARAWARSDSPASQEKVALWNKVKDHLVAKPSHPYKPGQLSNFMHNKTVEVDDSVVITGSFNFSNNATHNAENIVIVSNAKIAKQYGAYIDDLVITYGGMDRKKEIKPKGK